MKYIQLLTMFLCLGIFACTSDKPTEKNSINIEAYESYGELFEINKLLSKEEAKKEFKKLDNGDSVKVQFKAPMNEVCVMKGCWMVLGLGENETARVSFKDYGFFVPKESVSGTEVIVNGWAHIKKTSVKDLQHLAQDAGKSQTEIELITEPEIGYSLIADGVLMKKIDS